MLEQDFNQIVLQLMQSLKEWMAAAITTKTTQDQIEQWVIYLRQWSQACDVNQKRILLRKISDEISAFKKDRPTREKAKQLNQRLHTYWEKQGGTACWKSDVLHSDLSLVSAHRLFKANINYSNTAEISLIHSSNQRFALHAPTKAALQRISGAWNGSTFITNQPALRKDQGQMVLDAIDIAYVLNSQGQLDGAVIAIADGCGGHFGDSFQDLQIARAAHFATKQAVRLLSSYAEPDHLTEADLKTCIEDIKQEILAKAQLDSTTTLLAARLFRYQGCYRLVGFNVGDSFLLAWDKKQKKLMTLLPACEMAQGTAQLPGPHQQYEVHCYLSKTLLPSDLIVFPFTDGVGDVLRQKSLKKQYPDGTDYQEYTIDDPILEKRLSAVSATAEIKAYLQVFQKLVIERSDAKRAEQLQLQNPIQLGDDLMLGAMDLSPALFPLLSEIENKSSSYLPCKLS